MVCCLMLCWGMAQVKGAWFGLVVGGGSGGGGDGDGVGGGCCKGALLTLQPGGRALHGWLYIPIDM